MCLNACGQSNQKNTKDMIENSVSNVAVFISNFANYSMDIQAAGIASIPDAKLAENGELFIEYIYTSGGENRECKMTLFSRCNHRYEGNWKTDADNGNSYDGTLYFVFDERGNAKGVYKYGGGDYDITILKKKE